MNFIMLLADFAIFFAFGYLLGSKFKRRLPPKKEFEVGLASFIGIMILGFTVVFYLHVNRDAIFAGCFGLAAGIGSGIRLIER